MKDSQLVELLHDAVEDLSSNSFFAYANLIQIASEVIEHRPPAPSFEYAEVSKNELTISFQTQEQAIQFNEWLNFVRRIR